MSKVNTGTPFGLLGRQQRKEAANAGTKALSNTTNEIDPPTPSATIIELEKNTAPVAEPSESNPVISGPELQSENVQSSDTQSRSVKFKAANQNKPKRNKREESSPRTAEQQGKDTGYTTIRVSHLNQKIISLLSTVQGQTHNEFLEVLLKTHPSYDTVRKLL